MASYGGAMASGEFAGTKYQNPEPNKKKQEEEWTKQSLAKQAAEKVENQSAYQGAKKSGELPSTNSVAPPPNPVYNNPVGSAAALNRSEAKINPYVNPTKPAYQGAMASGELSQPTPTQKPLTNISTLFGDTYKYPQSPVSKPTTPTFEPLSPLQSAIWAAQQQPVTIPKEPNSNPFLANKSFPPFTAGYLYNPAPSKPPTTPSIYDREEKYGLAPNIPKTTSGLTYEQLIDKVYNDPQNSGLSALEKEQILNNLVSDPKYYQAMISGSLPPEGAGAFAPATTTQSSTQDDLLSAALAAQKSPYQGAGASGELAGAISTPTGTTSPTTPSDSPGKGTQIRTKIEGQPWNNGWKLPWKQGGYTEEELILAGNNYVGKYDNKAQYELRGKNQYEGYYLAPNGNYYPVNQNKAEYAISRGAANLSQSKFNSPEYMDYYYDGYSSDVDDFIRTFGTENLWRYDPNWKNAGLKYSNPSSWNTGSGSSGNGASGNLGNNQQDGRGWYFNPAVNWAT